MSGSLDDLIKAYATVLGLPVAPEWEPAVKEHLTVTLRLGQQVADFKLPDEAEPAPVFTA